MRRAPPRRVAAAAAAAAAALPEGEGGQPVDIRDAGTGRVWRVALGSGRLLALKLASVGAPLGGELRTLRWLAQRAAPVPAVLAADGAPQPDWLALEWCGDSTLDDALQGAAAPGAVAPGGAGRGAAVGDARWGEGEGGKRLVRAVAALEGAFWPISAGARRRAEWDQQVAALRAQAEPWLAAAPLALAWLLQGRAGGGAGAGAATGALRRAVELALHGEPDVGSLDYNARNVVLDEAGGRVTLVDFAATGVDWPERRLVQYATATGGGASRGAAPVRPPAPRATGRLPARSRGDVPLGPDGGSGARLRRAGGAEAGRRPGGGGRRGGRPRGAAAAGGGGRTAGGGGGDGPPRAGQGLERRTGAPGGAADAAARAR